MTDVVDTEEHVFADDSQRCAVVIGIHREIARIDQEVALCVVLASQFSRQFFKGLSG